ncbi:MAG: tetratricopeptide (TPR) repeat protein [Lysobacterales bacterium]|jgi:tetratricopeptide (TPR) repeat protein
MLKIKPAFIPLFLMSFGLATVTTSFGQQGSAHEHGGHQPVSWQGVENIGEVDFKTSCRQGDTQALINAGLGLLHSFEYEFALLNFQSAQEIEPSCAFAYWGEAMTNLKIIFFALNYQSASDIYARMEQFSELENINEKERALVDATRVLITEGDKQADGTDESSSIFYYRNAMQRVHEKWPNDPDIATFYSLAVIGTRFGIEDFSTNLVSGTPVESLITMFPKHPGLLHLTLHSYENRWQSWRSKIAGETYAKYSPGTIHSLHMPSHYYYYRGDWDALIKINENAWSQSKQQQQQLDLDEYMREYHGYSWAIYAWLQQEQYSRAYAGVKDMLESKQSGRRDYYLTHVIADFILQSPKDTPHRQTLIDMPFDVSQVNAENKTGYLFVQAWDAFNKGDKNKAHKMIERIDKDVSVEGQARSVVDEVAIMKAQLNALSDYYGGNTERALASLRKTAQDEENSFIEHGVPLIIKPTHELLGDILLDMERYGEALRYYKLSALFHRGRRLSVQGVLKAAQLTGDDEEIQHATMRLNKLLGTEKHVQ